MAGRRNSAFPKQAQINRQEEQEVHEMMLRMNSKLNTYLEYWKMRTGVDKSQMIRLLIFLAPHNKLFNQIMESFTKPERKGIVYIHQWNDDEDDLWMKLNAGR